MGETGLCKRENHFSCKKKIHGKDISDKYNIVKGLLFGMCVGDHLTNQKKKEEKK